MRISLPKQIIHGLASIVLLAAPLQAQAPPKTAAADKPVVIVERPGAVQKFVVDPISVGDMLARALHALTGKTDAKAAWEALGINKSDTVGIKISTTGGPLLSSHKALVQAISAGLMQAGIAPERIIIWDKLEDEMREADWAPRPATESQPEINSVITGTGFDGKQFYVNEILGRLIWGDFLFTGKQPSRDDILRIARETAQRESDPFAVKDPNTDIFDQVSNKSFYANLVTNRCTKIINVPVLSDSVTTGLNGCLASLALGSVDNTRRFANEEMHGETAIPEILEKDFFRKKVVLHIMDALVAQFAGGPRFNPTYTQSAGTLYVSRDPVAIDALALARVEEWRRAASVVELKETASHVKSAATYGLGEADVKKIKIIKVP